MDTYYNKTLTDKKVKINSNSYNIDTKIPKNPQKYKIMSTKKCQFTEPMGDRQSLV